MAIGQTYLVHCRSLLIGTVGGFGLIFRCWEWNRLPSVSVVIKVILKKVPDLRDKEMMRKKTGWKRKRQVFIKNLIRTILLRSCDRVNEGHMSF